MYYDNPLKKIFDCAKNINDFAKISFLTSEKNYLLKLKGNLTILIATNKISNDEVDKVMQELIISFNKRHHTNYVYFSSYYYTIDLLVRDMDIYISNNIYNKFYEKIVDNYMSNYIVNI